MVMRKVIEWKLITAKLMIKNWPVMFRILFMYLQLRLRSQNLKRKRRKKTNTKQCLKFRDSQGSEVSIPNLACSSNPAKDLGISGLEGSLKVTHSKLPPMQEFPLKPPQQVANPHIRLNASREGVCNPFVGQPWLFLVMGPEGGKNKQQKKPLSNNCSIWQTSCLRSLRLFPQCSFKVLGNV